MGSNGKSHDYFTLPGKQGFGVFWENLEKAFKEIHRVLAPGGIAYIGGGFGTSELKKE
ncbi:MAG: methyltransferase domain-containing protein, partial [Clostridia bacterium]|nr:methyltransferase domain-containing protein [Clostridia bacterium]